ncbi:MAG: redoxin domain-containing protein [Chloroflexota bacterium]
MSNASVNAMEPAGNRASVRIGARSGRFRWIAGIVLLAVVAPLVWYGATRPLVAPGAGVAASQGGAAKGVGPLLDHEAPNFRLKDPSGAPIELRQFRGKAVVLNFWATWCVPCREEMPELERLYRLHKESPGLVVLAVSIDDESSARHVPEYLKEGDPQVGSYTFPVALDTKQEVVRLYKLGGVPSSFFIDSAGVIRAVQPGAMNRQTMLERLRTVLPLASGA